jgi:hypothetical protein
MGQAKQRKQNDPSEYGQPLFYEAIFFDQPHVAAFSIALDVPRRPNKRDQLAAAIRQAEQLQWCLTWRSREATQWRMANAEPGAFYSTAVWVAQQLRRKLLDVDQQLDWAPELAERESQRIGITPEQWEVLLTKLQTLDQQVWLWELWPPVGGDGWFEDECLYRAFQGQDMEASKMLRSQYPMAGDVVENMVRL